MYDALVIGGGFYGASLAIYLREQRGFRRVLLVERERDLLLRASYNNQARVHNGYHYPRSFTTAYRSRVNLPRFVRDFSDAVKRDFIKIYAIARNNSKVSARQFERFCREIGASLDIAPAPLRALFEPRLIESVFLVEEYVFDSSRLAAWARRKLAENSVEQRFGTRVRALAPSGPDALIADVERGGEVERVDAQYVFNCTYSGLNQIGGAFPRTRTSLKHEITEMALVDLPEELASLGITVMDGAFFSLMPFPARGKHTLSHVRYTPHMAWQDEKGLDPYERLNHYTRESRVDRMIRDAARYMPAVARANYAESLFEVKTVLVKNEADDGRPILFERHEAMPNCYSVLGGKIDNIYDVLEKLDEEPLQLKLAAPAAAESLY